MYSATRVNQFEIKDTCFQFVINVSRQGINVKMKYNLKIDLQRLQPCLVLSKHIHNSVKQVIRSILQKQATIFAKASSQMFHQVLNTSPIIVSGYICFFYYFFRFGSIKFRSSRSHMPFKIKVFKNFAIFTGVIFSHFSEYTSQKKDVLSLSKQNFN